MLDELPPKTHINNGGYTAGKALLNIAACAGQGLQSYSSAPLLIPMRLCRAPLKGNIHEEMLALLLPPEKFRAYTRQDEGRRKSECHGRLFRAKRRCLFPLLVIEVGINVPSAVNMVIVDAERWLAQLHQLRGRVGRGSMKSYCFLLSFAQDSELPGNTYQNRRRL